MIAAARIATALLCVAGFYVAAFMLRKTYRAERGLVDGASVVKEPQARLFFGRPNALFGCCYYVVLAAAVWFDAAVVHWACVTVAIVAAVTSVSLGYSLLFVTKRACPYCWTAHVVNWLLCVTVAFAA